MKLEGEIGEINVIEHLVEMGRESFTGAVRFENDGIIKIIYFKHGDVLSASTNDRADSVDEILLRANKVTREHVKQALAKRKENETLGDAMLGLGFITRKELTWARRAQVIGVIRSIESWSVGQFTVVADYLPKREEGTLFPLPQIIIELIVTDQDRQKYERVLEGGEAVFTKAAGFDERFKALGLNEDAEAIASQIDGRRSAADIASASQKDAFNVYKLLHALAQLGLLQRGDKVQVTPEISFGTEDDAAFATAAAADASDVWGESGNLSFGDAPATSFGTPAPSPEFHAEAPKFGEDEPALSLGLDFPSIPAPQQESAMLAPEPQPSPMPTWEAPAAVPPALTTPGAGARSTGSSKWDAPAYGSPVLQPPKEPQEQWGFDEAQIETARRATAPKPADRAPASMRAAAKKKGKPNRRLGMAIAAAVVILVAVGGFAGWNWWQSRNEAAQVQPAPAVHRAKRRTPPMTATTATTTAATATAATATTGTALTTTAAPTTAAPATATATPMTASKAPVTPAAAAAAPRPVPAPVASQTAPPPVLGTPPVAAAPSNAQKAQYDEMARNFAAQATGKYTVQFELVCEVASLKLAMNAGGPNVWFTPFPYKNRSCYRVFWGHYETEAQAAAAAAQIPSSLRGSKPVVVSVPKS